MSDRTHRFATIVVGALADLGVTHAVVAPGSRNTPLSMALAADERITDLSIHDERSGGFLAIGIARVTGRPVVITCTSGTAAAEFHPAVVEAGLSRTPIIVLTADRPHDLHDVGAPQTIDQVHLYGRAVRWSHDLEAPGPDVADPALASLAARLVSEATGTPPGPVHLNARFREPLVPDGPAPQRPATPRVVTDPVPPGRASIETIDRAVSGRRALLVAGPHDDPALADAVTGFAQQRRVPVLADPLSGLRGTGHGSILSGGDLLAAASFLDKEPPDVVIRVGAIPTSKPVGTWLEAHREVDQILVDQSGWRDPLASIGTFVRCDPAALFAACEGGAAAAGYLDAWIDADAVAHQATAAVIDAAPFPNEPAVAASVDRSVPEGSTLWLASSMPVRDMDTFGRTRTGGARMFGNRGANGIDGLISAAAGTALATPMPAFALAGDLSAFHDLNAIASAVRLGADLTVVIVNNDGGGIFHFLPQIEFQEVFERHFGTPHGLDFAPIANALGAQAITTDDRSLLEAELRRRPDGVRVIEVRTDRTANRELHRDVRRAVYSAVG